MNEVTNVQVPQKTGYFVSSGETVSFWRWTLPHSISWICRDRGWKV